MKCSGVGHEVRPAPESGFPCHMTITAVRDHAFSFMECMADRGTPFVHVRSVVYELCVCGKVQFSECAWFTPLVASNLTREQWESWRDRAGGEEVDFKPKSS